MKISKSQINGAMGILGLAQNELSEKAGLSKGTVSNFFSENPKWGTKENTKQQIIDYLVGCGIEFINDGVRKATFSVVTLEGREGFARFRRDVLAEVQKGDANVCISNLDERQFDKWGDGQVNIYYRSMMAEIRKNDPDLRFRSLIEKGDTHLSAARHSEYRWIDDHHFSDIPYYIYGQKTATLLFEEESMIIIVIKHPKVTLSYRKRFDSLWESAEKLTFNPFEYLPGDRI